jgi:uncharacterized protein (DUF305 family)
VERSAPDVSDLSLDQIVQLERRAAATEAGDGDGNSDGDDPSVDSIVLPWWQRPFNIAVLVVTAAILAGMVGWMVGDSGARPSHNDVDTGFLQDMRVHHEQAVLMSFIYRSRPDIDPGLNTVARDIVVSQSLEVGRMIQMLRTLGETEANETGTSMTWMDMVAEDQQMPGMASDAELEALGAAEGRVADEMFVELMTAHHLGGIEMADYALDHAENDEVLKMAAGMAAGQRSEITEMVDQLD